jgi:hypothetical protein
MAAIPRMFANINPHPSIARVELGNMVTSVTSIPKVQPIPPRISALLALAREPEDASITGGTRSLDRRLLALNLSGSLARMRPAAERSIPSRQAVA